jgi:hypothetical protein
MSDQELSRLDVMRKILERRFSITQAAIKKHQTTRAEE